MGCTEPAQPWADAVAESTPLSLKVDDGGVIDDTDLTP
jgi:hypothetical protein